MNINPTTSHEVTPSVIDQSAIGEEVHSTIHYSRGMDVHDNRPEQKEAVNFAAFRDAILNDRSPRKFLTYFCAPFEKLDDGGYRKAERVQPRRFLSFDLDGARDMEVFTELCVWLHPYSGFCYTTASHKRDNPHARFVLETSREISRDEGIRLGEAMQAKIESEIDGGTFKLDQCVYRGEQPVFTPLENADEYLFDGDPVDVDTTLATSPKPTANFDSSKRHSDNAGNDPVLKRLFERDMVKKVLENGRYAVVCPREDAHTTDSGETSTIYCLPNYQGVKFGKFICLHSHCVNRDQPEFFKALGLDPNLVWREQNPSEATRTNDAWPHPQPLVTEHEKQPYPIDALPSGIRGAVAEVIDFVQCPPALAACSALSVLSLVGQGLADVEREPGLKGPTSLYFLAIAESGERKTSCDRHFLSPITNWERRKADEAKPDLDRYDANINTWNAEHDGIKEAIKQAAKKGAATDGLKQKLGTLIASKPLRPRVPNMVRTDTTPEALASALATQWSSGGVMSSEAGTVLGGHGMNADAMMRNLALLNTLWDGCAVKVERRTSESFTLEGARLTMGLAVQPETLRAFFDNSKGLARGTGFAARFLIAEPESTQGNRPFKPAPKDWQRLSAFQNRLSLLLDSAPDPGAKGRLDLKTLKFSPLAKTAWVAFHDEVEGRLKQGGDLTEARDVASKAADNVARLAALLHLYEEGATGAIGEHNVRSATQIVWWHLYEARRFLGEVSLSKESSNVSELDGWLLRYCRSEGVSSVSTRDILQRGPRKIRKQPYFDTAMQELSELGRARLVKLGSKKIVEINPILLSQC